MLTDVLDTVKNKKFSSFLGGELNLFIFNQHPLVVVFLFS